MQEISVLKRQTESKCLITQLHWFFCTRLAHGWTDGAMVLQGAGPGEGAQEKGMRGEQDFHKEINLSKTIALDVVP